MKIPYMSPLSWVEARLVKLGKRLQISSIRARLLLAFVLMAVMSAIAISAGSMLVGYFSGRQQVQDRLNSVAALKALSVHAWTDTLQTGLLMVSSDQYASQRVSVVLGLAKAGKDYVWYDDALRVRLRTFIEETPQFDEICLLDVRGEVVLCSSGPTQTIEDCHTLALFQKGLVGPVTEIAFSPSDEPSRSQSQPTADGSDVCDALVASSQFPFAVSARPVISSQGEHLGVIVGRSGAHELIDILANRTGLGRTGKAYLVSSSFQLLSAGADESKADDYADVLRRSSGVATAFQYPFESSGINVDYRGANVLGTYRWIPELQVVLAVEQNLSEAFSGIIAALAVNIAIGLIAALVAGGVSFLLTRSITQSLVGLVETATQIAGGHLERTAPVFRDDEIGRLATAFNSMTAQLRDLISHLEQRVQNRTRALNEANEALQRRAMHMETSAAVSREITSILEIDQLLTHVVHLIRDSFGYSHVRIFLLDGKELILRASTGECAGIGARVRLDSTSPNMQALHTGQPLIVDDGPGDSHMPAQDSLSDIRSELATAIRVGDHAIGTLDVLSDQPNAFAAEDVLVIQSLGDQIAVAIENARLYAHGRQVAILEERHRLARDLHDSVIQSLYSLSLLLVGWRRLLKSGESMNVEEYFDRAAAISQQALREMRLLVYELRPSSLEQDGLLAALQQRMDAVERRAGVKALLIAEGVFDLPIQVQECLYWIGLEALNNSLKHSGASEVTLRLHVQADLAHLHVTDNGCGFDTGAPAARGGMGMEIMRQRAQDMGGEIVIESELGKGTTVTARICCSAYTQQRPSSNE